MSVVMLQKEMGMTFRTIQGLVLVGFLGLTACARLMADDGADPKVISALRQELEELRSENRSLREENSVLRKENRELREASKRSDTSSGESKDQIVGKIWEITATGRGGKKFGPARFLAHDGNIYVDSLDNPKVGTYTEKGPNVRVDIFNAKMAEANGVYNLIQISKVPPTYTGNATNTNGVTFRVQLRMLTD